MAIIKKKGDIDIDTMVIIIVVVLFLIIGIMIIAKYTGRGSGILDAVRNIVS